MSTMRNLGTTWPALLFLLWSSGCGDTGYSLPADATRGYILISIDTLRADRLGCYGYRRDTSPFLDSLAEKSVLFENSYVQLPGTLPSHMSIFTGLYPAEHNVYAPAGVLSPDIRTLPEVFQEAGYRTAGFTEGGFVHGGYGFARGFDEFSDDHRQTESDVEDTLNRGLDFLRRIEAGDNFFLFLHTYVVHDPYFPPEKYKAMFWDGDEPSGAVPPTGPDLSALNNRNVDGVELPRQVLEYYEALYDAQIRYADDLLRRFFSQVESLGLMEDVTIVFTSDHGEEFLEHGKLLHSQVYRESLHVPLLVYRSDFPTRRVRNVVESVDIAPTLLDLAGLVFPEPVSGISLKGFLGGGATEEPLEAYSEHWNGSTRSLVRSAGDGVYHLLWRRLNYGMDMWLSREMAFEVVGEEVSFTIASFHHPRQLEVFVDDEKIDEFEIGLEWQEKKYVVPAGEGARRVLLRAADCDTPASLGINEDHRCLSFQASKPVLERFELFEIESDPRESKDLSESLGEKTASLGDLLRRYEFEARSTGESRDLDPELREHLKALGYL